jgi:ABC-2 type transport system permease protein
MIAILVICLASIPSMTSGARANAETQPVTSIVEAVRALFSNQPVGIEIWVALAWCVGIMLMACGLAMRIYRKRE